jgi:transcription antitermination factor NusG
MFATHWWQSVGHKAVLSDGAELFLVRDASEWLLAILERTNFVTDSGSRCLMFGNQWFAAYTYPRHEKKAAKCLIQRGVETFLPLFRESHLWRNGVRSIVEAPLFPGYLFVRMNATDRVKVLQSPSIACLVSHGGVPVPLPQDEVERLQLGTKHLNFLPHPYLEAGDRVRIKTGPLVDMEGVLVSFKNQWRVVICVDLLRQAASVEIELGEVERLTSKKTVARLAG